MFFIPRPNSADRFEAQYRIAVACIVLGCAVIVAGAFFVIGHFIVKFW